MRFLGVSKGHLLFHLTRRDKDLLLRLLALYPRIPAAYQRLSKSCALPDPDANQQLLEEALAEQRAENRAQLQALLTDPKRLTEKETGWQLTLARGEAEWLLQVLNDIRVGSWIALGSPEEQVETLNEETVPQLWAMEMAGFLEILLLGALKR